MPRLTLFLKGNVDVHDSLHSCRIGGELAWNGINEVLRTHHAGWVARIRHETWTRSDALLRSEGHVPAGLSARTLPMGSYPAESQFSHAVFEAKADAIVLSIQPDISTGLVKHKSEGYLLYPSESETWSAEDRQWLKSDFERIGYLEFTDFVPNLAAVVERIRKQSEAPILIYNMSPLTPGEAIYCHQGLGEVYSTRIRRFNLGLIELSERTGVAIIDVESIVARNGGDALKLDTVHLTPQGHRLVAGEVVRVLGDLGVFDGKEG